MASIVQLTTWAMFFIICEDHDRLGRFMGPQEFSESPETACRHEIAGVSKFCHTQRARYVYIEVPDVWPTGLFEHMPKPDGRWEYLSITRSTNTWQYGVLESFTPD